MVTIVRSIFQNYSCLPWCARLSCCTCKLRHIHQKLLQALAPPPVVLRLLTLRKCLMLHAVRWRPAAEDQKCLQGGTRGSCSCTALLCRCPCCRGSPVCRRGHMAPGQPPGSDRVHLPLLAGAPQVCFWQGACPCSPTYACMAIHVPLIAPVTRETAWQRLHLLQASSSVSMTAACTSGCRQNQPTM